MTEVEAAAALERIARIADAGSELAPMPFGAAEEGVADGVWERLQEELRAAAEALRAFVRTEDAQVGTVVTDWTGDVYCVWDAGTGAAARSGHLERFQAEFTVRVRVGYVLAAVARTAVGLATLAAPPLTVLSAARAVQAARGAWELVEEVQRLRAAMGR